MTDPRTIAADPAWLPHGLDAASRRVLFLHVPREQLAGPGFLSERTPQSATDHAWLSFDEVKAMRPRSGPLHFVFHTAFCRSTLLIRALDSPGLAAGLSEPGVFNSLRNAGEAAAEMIKPVLDLLSRSHAPGEPVFVKPTNHANMLIPALLAARPDARAVLMTNALPAFLASVARKGLLGRRWGRQLWLELMGYAGMDFGMDSREQFAMTDMQAAGLAWFLNQSWFAQLLDRHGERLRVLDGDRFDAERARTLIAVADFAGLELSREQAEAAAQGRVFARHSKLGGDFAAREAADRERTSSPIVDEEFAQVGEWVAMIARQARVEAPLRQTLF